MADIECCTLEADRLTNDELVALMQQVIMQGGAPLRSLQQTAAPIFHAYYRGHALAGRVDEGDIAQLVREALDALERDHGTFNPNIPCRAWLLEIARLTMIRHHGHPSGESIQPACAPATELSGPSEPICSYRHPVEAR